MVANDTDVLWHIVMPFPSGSLPLGPASLTNADGYRSAQHRPDEPIASIGCVANLAGALELSG